MSEIRFLIARHGETEYNKKGLMQGRGIDAPLNEKGIQQAKKLASYLQKYETTLLVSSSKKRAIETAGYYSENSGLPLIKSPALDEMDFGDFEGRPYDDVITELADIDQAWRRGDIETKIPGGESPLEVYNRANEEISAIIYKQGKGIITIVVHGRLMRILFAEWLGYGIKNMHLIQHENGAVNQFVYKNGVFNPVYLNKTTHLNGL
ncbi:MAG: histidine phosphatase family protein [Balneolaceae bacterium]|nr:MAG: histidine phosphatase family protein [Balneolaceae bacterium]